MKHLGDYTQDAMTSCMEKHGVFFAFSREQMDKQRVEGVTYCQTGFGMLIPEDNVEKFTSEQAEIRNQCIQLDIKENGKDGIIKRELANHECYYTGDISDCVEAVVDYGFTIDDVRKVFGE